MLHHRSPKPLKLLALFPLLYLPHIATAQVSNYFPPWLEPCLRNCQALWSANFDCAQAGQQSLDCLCQSGWVQEFYDGGTCTCTSESDAQEFRNWFDGSNGCGVYVEERIQSSLEASTRTTSSARTSRRTSSTSERTSTSESDSSSSTRSRSSTARSTSATTTSSQSSARETTITTNGSTFTTRAQTSRTGTTVPSLATSDSADSGDKGWITEENKKWVIPTITVGGLVVVGALAVGVAYFCFGCCRRGGRGKYAPADNPAGGVGMIAAKKRKRLWLSSLPFFGSGKDKRDSQNSLAMSLVEDPQRFDTAYYGAGAEYPPPNNGNYQWYQHGTPLAPIDEVQSIADSTMQRDRGFHDDDERSDFSWANSAVSGYTPVNNGTGPGYVFYPGYSGNNFAPPAPVVQSTPTIANGIAGAGLIGTAIATGNRRGDPDRKRQINSEWELDTEKTSSESRGQSSGQFSADRLEAFDR
ncbi:hypothetical protein ABW19_dt0203107 [Dactylella cylindrospora]|nr:hypothetical protein ABW19_dt0203107 [Dactylella cylindrospora]